MEEYIYPYDYYMNPDSHRLPHLERPQYIDEFSLTSEASLDVLKKPVFRSEDLPRPTTRQEDHGVYTTLGQLPPPPDSNFIVNEQKISSPRYLRHTLNYIPLDNSTHSNTGLPISSIWHPYCEIPENEDPVHITSSPLSRCARCFGYINSNFKFVQNYTKYKCNLCGNISDSQNTYKNHPESFAELSSGTYEFVAPGEYSNKPPQLPLFLFCIDVSQESIRLGILQQVLLSIKSVLPFIPAPERTLVGLITFDQAMQLYKVSSTGNLIEIIVNDPEDLFIPEPVSSFCYNTSSDREILEILFEKLLEKDFTGTKEVITIGSLINSIKEHLLKARGGRVILFTTQLGTYGKYKLPNTSEHDYKTTKNTEQAFKCNESYMKLAKECNNEDICLDIFGCTHNYINVPTLASVCTSTGGDFYYFPGYSVELHSEKLHYIITRILTRPQCLQVKIKIRCSKGLSVDYCIGKFTAKKNQDIEIPYLDSDKSFLVVLKYDEKLKEDAEYFIQFAMLYTNVHGSRFIRIFNGMMYATADILDTFNYADVDCAANSLIRIAAYQMFSLNLSTVRHNLVLNLINLAVTYRKKVNDKDFGKILIPSALNFLPLYCNTALKNPGITGAKISFEIKAYSIHNLLSMHVLESRLLLYPKIYSIHDVPTKPHSPGTYNNCALAVSKLVTDSAKYLRSDGVYLISNGKLIMVYIGGKANKAFISNVWGFSSVKELFNYPEHWEIRAMETGESLIMNTVIEYIRKNTPGAYSPIHIYFEGLSDNKMFNKLMVEDSCDSELSYTEFMNRLNKIVEKKINKL
jgi:protein transport protein SEC24